MPRVLVAEDEKDIQFLFRAWLRREGYEVVTADDGAEAVETCDSQPFDAVVLDVKMPRMDGIEACRTIRMKHADVPISMVSVMARPDDVASGLAAGADSYVVKPVTPREVTLRLSEILPTPRHRAQSPERGSLGSRAAEREHRVGLLPAVSHREPTTETEG